MTDDDGADLIRDFRDLPNGQDSWGEPCRNLDAAWNEWKVRQAAERQRATWPAWMRTTDEQVSQ